ncbi:protein TSSC4 [Anguilla anguilla]|uniref:protein TSSC4 n=1 Tax=Anguilla anguilla TaxID=7936 RepID=UPI0015A78E08|nr:protein TSSC4 [Anguilla anguilla]XP_035266425.1 protein TSSC4 [Anguilla anguilla]XP_035266426.1 protein TSSC4 [Anguilla anguilla]XP_035266427.1 protein TSSC4 [Anguilla anguilla]XP_035266428.1 protein TSSC4 [Anguilla anguilla]
MCDQEKQSSAALVLANTDSADLSDTSSLSESDPEDSATPFDAEVENLSSSSSSSGEASPDRDPLGDRVGMGSGPGSRKPSFQLKGGSAGFSSRSQSIFDCLESAAKLASPGLGEDNVIDGTFLRPMPPPSHRKREEKREAAAGKPSSAAGAPESPTRSPRWTKYSLEDVPEISDQKNSQVALEYIQGLQREKGSLAVETQEPFVPAFNQDHTSSGDSKILFSRPGRRDEGQAAKDKAPEGCRPDGGRKQEVGLLHLEDPEEEPKPAEPSSGQRKRNSVSVEEEEDDGQQPSAVGFNCSRKVNRKKFRRGGEEEEAED